MSLRLFEEQSMDDAGTVSRDGIRNTERKWIVYRDALAAFGAARYPQVGKAKWLIWATKKRTEQLQALLAELQ